MKKTISERKKPSLALPTTPFPSPLSLSISNRPPLLSPSLLACSPLVSYLPLPSAHSPSFSPFLFLQGPR